MSQIRAIRSDADHKAALARIDALMDAVPGTPEGDELDVLADLVEHYEEKHVPIGHPSPAAAIRFRMEQAELSPRDLVPIIGSRAKVARIYDALREEGMPAERLTRVHAPIGLDIGAVTPQEIAVSILAELIAVKHGRIKGRDAAEISMQWNNLKVKAG